VSPLDSAVIDVTQPAGLVAYLTAVEAFQRMQEDADAREMLMEEVGESMTGRDTERGGGAWLSASASARLPASLTPPTATREPPASSGAGDGGAAGGAGGGGAPGAGGAATGGGGTAVGAGGSPASSVTTARGSLSTLTTHSGSMPPPPGGGNLAAGAAGLMASPMSSMAESPSPPGGPLPEGHPPLVTVTSGSSVTFAPVLTSPASAASAAGGGGIGGGGGGGGMRGGTASEGGGSGSASASSSFHGTPGGSITGSTGGAARPHGLPRGPSMMVGGGGFDATAVRPALPTRLSFSVSGTDIASPALARGVSTGGRTLVYHDMRTDEKIVAGAAPPSALGRLSTHEGGSSGAVFSPERAASVTGAAATAAAATAVTATATPGGGMPGSSAYGGFAMRPSRGSSGSAGGALRQSSPVPPSPMLPVTADGSPATTPAAAATAADVVAGAPAAGLPWVEAPRGSGSSGGGSNGCIMATLPVAASIAAGGDAQQALDTLLLAVANRVMAASTALILAPAAPVVSPSSASSIAASDSAAVLDAAAVMPAARRSSKRPPSGGRLPALPSGAVSAAGGDAAAPGGVVAAAWAVAKGKQPDGSPPPAAVAPTHLPRVLVGSGSGGNAGSGGPQSAAVAALMATAATGAAALPLIKPPAAAVHAAPGLTALSPSPPPAGADLPPVAGGASTASNGARQLVHQTSTDDAYSVARTVYTVHDAALSPLSAPPPQLGTGHANGASGGSTGSALSDTPLFLPPVKPRRSSATAAAAALAAATGGAAQPSAHPLSVLGDLAAVTVLGVPIAATEGAGYPAMGAIVLQSAARGTFEAADRAAVDMVAASVAQARRRIQQVGLALAAQRRAYGLVEMVKAVSHELETPAIITRIIGVAYDLLQADRVSVFLVDRDRSELMLAVSEDAAGFRLPLGQGIVGSVAASGAPVNIPDAYASPLFNPGFDVKTGYRTRSILAMPVKDPAGEVVAVIQAINKTVGGAVEVFTAEDVRTLAVVSDTAGVTLHKASLLKEAHAAKEASAALAEVVRIANEAAEEDMETLTSRLVEVAYRLVDADRILLFLVDELKNELYCQVCGATEGGGGGAAGAEGTKLLRIPVGHGIAGAAAAECRSINIDDAYADPRFDREMDASTGYRTRTLLTMPIVSHTRRKPVAVIMASNKIGGVPFSRADEKLLDAYSTEVGALLDRVSLQLALSKAMAEDGTADGGVMSSLLTQYARDAPASATGRGRGRGGRATARVPSSRTTPRTGNSPQPTAASGVASGSGTATSLPSAERMGSRSASVDGNLGASGAHASEEGGEADHTASPSRGAPSRRMPPLHAEVTGGDAASTARAAAALVATSTGAAAVAPTAPVPTPAALPAPAPVPASAGGTSAPAPAPAPAPAASPAAGAPAAAPAPASAPAPAAAPAPAPAPAPAAVPASPASSPTRATGGSAPAGVTTMPPTPEVETPPPDPLLQRVWLSAPARPGRGPAREYLTSWQFDALRIGDDALEPYVLDMVAHFDLVSTLSLDVGALAGFVSAVRGRYRANPYHNFKHGVSVAQICFLALHHTRAATLVLTPVERLAVLLGGLCHDVDHPGVNNVFESNTFSELAVRYNDASVLENYHSALMFSLLRPSEVGRRPVPGSSSGAEEEAFSLLRLPRADFQAFRRTAVSGILATDMTHHNALTEAARKLTPAAALALPAKSMVELFMHSADLSNPVLPDFDAVYQWSTLVCNEFQAQVNREKALGLPFAPHMDNLTTELAVAKLQGGFIDYVVAPLWNAMATGFPELACAAEALAANKARWRGIADGSAAYTAPALTPPAAEVAMAAAAATAATAADVADPATAAAAAAAAAAAPAAATPAPAT